MAKKKGKSEKTIEGGAKAEKKSRRPRQEQLPALQDKRDDELLDLAEKYVEVRDERMALTGQEVEKRETLRAAMKSRGLSAYNDPSGLVVTLETSEKIKVKRAGDDEDGDE